MNDEFYIGWQSKALAAIGSWVRRVIASLFAFAVALSVLLAVAQRTIGVSVFEWGKIKSFSGILKSQPYPHLLVPRPGANAAPAAFSSYYLVKPFKFGFDPETASRFDGRVVSLEGTLIYRANQTMIEVVNDSVKPLNSPERHPASASAVRPMSLGEQTFIGEIVDSKCYLGVMNPGQLTTHRACAIRCISGGIPPVLLVRQANGTALYLLLVSREGRAVNQQVLNLVAEPVQITGEVERQGELLILRADPATYQRIDP
jgi:hypothetical protein